MDESGQRENVRHKQDQYKLHAQLMNTPHLMKDHQAMTMKVMSILAERDAAIHERNLAVSEKKAAVAERDMAIMQRDAAIAERNNALMERDNAMAALEYRENTAVNVSGVPTCPQGCRILRATKQMHRPQDMHHPSHLNEACYNTRDMISDGFSIPAAASEAVRPRRAKRTIEAKALPSKKASAPSKKGKRGGGEINRQVPFAKTLEWKSEQCMGGSGEDLNKQLALSKPEWKCQDLGLNEVAFDDSIMPVPGCSCTGVLQQCYKWGKGGWQSACCTTTMSVYPLPVMPNKRHARLGGRKMSGSAFAKLLSRLASEGRDLSAPLDLKDHWAKHGTNRYITIK
ncbi:hypothetical protein IFM89_002893 [Coptis chinensis]|uniref:GAGA-binding transcriptional activator n=1 Tax=Coptis chinensis TaxID=261450 RepID=A0A835INM9_9MAGN|nr:hypothetical protein IFM89_002893 [Coptis chinensis]